MQATTVRYNERLKQQNTDFNNTLAVLTSQLDATKAKNECLLTSADLAQCNQLRQLVELQQEKEELAHKVKQHKAEIQKLHTSKAV